MKTLRQVIEGTVVSADFKMSKSGRKYKAHRREMGKPTALEIAKAMKKGPMTDAMEGTMRGGKYVDDAPRPGTNEVPVPDEGYRPPKNKKKPQTTKLVDDGEEDMREDVEQVDELSYGTLRSYTDKAKAENLPGKGGNRGVALLTPGTRDKGVHRAVDRMKKMKTNEAKDPREYDYEGDMAKSQLRGIIANAKQVHDMLKDDTNMAEWVQSKITLSADYISTVADYMQSEVKEDVNTRDLDEARGRPASAATLAKRAAAAKPRDDDDEGDHYDADSGVEADQHIHVQLKKAVDSTNKPYEVSFKNGKKHTVSSHVAKNLLDATERLKPEHRKNVHDEIHKSYDSLIAVHKMIVGK